MSGPIPDHYENPETSYEGLIQEFTDDAIYPEPRNGSSSAPDTAETKPPATPPSAGPPAGEAQH